MTLAQTLLSTQLLLAAAVYGIASVIALPLFSLIHTRLQQPLLQASWDHVGMPLLRAALLILFILLAYPALYGLADAPALGLVITQGQMRMQNMLNLVFLLALLFPLLPVIGRWHELVLPLQGAVAAMLLFSWIAADLGLTQVSYWPDLHTFIGLLLLTVIGHWLAMLTVNHIGHRFDDLFQLSGAGEVLGRIVIMFVQGPVIVILAHGLGRQLPA